MKFAQVLSTIALSTFGYFTSVSASAQVEEGYIRHDRILTEGERFGFVPLQCNSDLNEAPCLPWSEVIGTGDGGVYTERVEITCGTCVTMDESHNEIVFMNGLDIKGKLIFPDGYRATIRATMIAVQGELEITAIKEVDGQPSLTFVMIGEEEEAFLTGLDNIPVCGNRCIAGKKSVVIAGGKVNIRGLSDNAPTWLDLYDVGGDDPLSPDRIVVSDAVRGTWGVGAEILITSHTRDWQGQQVRTIATISDHTTAGYVDITLNEAIIRPTTAIDSPDFAVEVALLSRNILFLGGDDSTEYHGGHFVVLRTPSVEQFIQGAEFRKFGQAGTLGRYPIHFHLARDVAGSKILKNTVRESFQRCVVVHGSDNLLVEENVAFDTKGHCFMLEDGYEVGNRFANNLGAQTGRLLRPLTGKKVLARSGEESDGQKPSTFWISHPRNMFEGNLAAGAEDSGFWFELFMRGTLAPLYPGLDPEFEPLTLFKGNKSHSNKVNGIRTYPAGYTPDEMAVFEGLRIYRNTQTGILFHLCKGMIVQDSVFADNGLGIDIDRAEDIEIRDTTFIGISPTYRDIVETQGERPPCHVRRSTGIELHQNRDDRNERGVIIEDVVFEHYVDSLCTYAFPIRFDDTMKTGMFDMFTQWQNVVFDSNAPVLNWCSAIGAGAIDGYLTDLDGSLAPQTADPTLHGRPAALVAGTLDNYDSMLHFVDHADCHQIPAGCYTYCQDVCLRTVRYQIDPANSHNYRLRVCRKDDDHNCIFLPGFYGSSDPHKSRQHRIYATHLPAGEYTAVFVDGNQPVFPNFVLEKYEASQCEGALADGAVELLSLEPTTEDCRELIRNGSVDESDTEAIGWLHDTGDLELALGQGVRQSNAVKGVKTRLRNTLVQFIDTRCMVQGRTYELSALVKLVDGNNVARQPCDPQREVCPDIGYRFGGTNHGEFRVAEASAGFVEEGFQRITGLLTITEDLANALEPQFYVKNVVKGYALLVDNASMRLVEDGHRFLDATELFQEKEQGPELRFLRR